MIELNNLGKYRKGRIWDSNIPQRREQIEQATRKISIAQRDKDLKEKHIALELYYPRNASNYGMLGLHFTPSNSDEIIIKTHVVKDNAVNFNESFVSKYDKVYLGIEMDYSDIILDSAEKYILDNMIKFTGVIEFCYGAYSLVGSSPMVFSKLTKLLLGVINLKTTEKKIIEQYISENM
jgi:hypothetical protein